MQPQPQVKSEPSKSAFPKLELTAEDHQAMEGMTDLQKKVYIIRRTARVYREGTLFNRRKLKNPDPNKQYCWVNIKEERRIFFEGSGWEPCRNPDVGSSYWKPDFKEHRCADLVLYEMPLELYEMIKADQLDRGLSITDSKVAEGALADAVRNLGVQVPIFQPKV